MNTRDFVIGMLCIVPFTMLIGNAWLTMVTESHPLASFTLVAVLAAFIHGVEKIERYFILRRLRDEA